MGPQWSVDADIYFSAASSLTASASSYERASISTPTITCGANADGSLMLRLDGSDSGFFSLTWRDTDDNYTELLHLSPTGDTSWTAETFTVPAGTGKLIFVVRGMSYSTPTQAWIDDVVLPESSGTPDVVASAPWQLWIQPPVAATPWVIRVGDFVDCAWPVSVLPPLVSTGWPIFVSAAPDADVSVAWPVRIGPLASVSVGWPLSILDASVTGGLAGTAAWAAAPDGRWRVTVLVDGIDISARVCVGVSIQIADDAARTASVQFLPEFPLQPLALIGRPVQIWFSQASGANPQLIFTGAIETPRVDAVTGVVSCACHDEAQEVWASMPRSAIDAMVGGRWHPSLGEPENNYEYLRERIQSVGASWALDAARQPRIIAWRSASPRTVDVRQSDVVDGSVSVTLPARSEIRTRIDCRLQYRYTRLRWRGAVAQYSQPIAFFVRPDLEKGIIGKQWLSRAQIMSAVDGVSGWDLVGAVKIEKPRPQAISPPAAVGGLGGIYMITAQSSEELALGFRASFSTRWQQSVTEDWTITVVCSSVEAQIGRPVADEIGATLEAKFDSPTWIADPTVQPMVDTVYQGDIIEPWQPDGADTASRDELMRSLLDRAWVRLWSSSRTGRVQFSLPCRPDIWLDTWVVLRCEHVNAAGKVVAVEHDLDPITGKAVSKITLSVGMPGAVDANHPVWTLPAPPVDDYVPPPGSHSFVCGTYVGGDFGSPKFDEELMIGFCTNVEDASLTDIERDARNWYPHQLSIKAPDIAARDRNPIELANTAEISVSVPTDLLEIF